MIASHDAGGLARLELKLVRGIRELVDLALGEASCLPQLRRC